MGKASGGGGNAAKNSSIARSKFSSTKDMMNEAQSRICWTRCNIDGKWVPGPSVFLGVSQRHVKILYAGERAVSCSISWELCDGGQMGWCFTNGRDKRPLVEAGYNDLELDQLVGAIICCFVFPEQAQQMQRAVPRSSEERKAASLVQQQALGVALGVALDVV